MKNENSRKLIIVGIALIILIISLFQNFVSFSTLTSEIALTMNTIDVKGCLIVCGGLGALILGFMIINKPAIFFGYLLSLGGYVYTAFVIIKASKLASGYNRLSDIVNIDLHLGFYLYVLSAIMLLISLFVKSDNSEVEDNKYDVEQLDRDSFLLCNMVLGVKEIPFNTLVLLKRDDNDLLINYQNGETCNTYKIPLNTIVDIVLSQDMSIGNEDNSLDGMSTVLAYSLFGGNLIAAMGASEIMNAVTDDYEKTEFKTCFVITIKYKNGDEESEIKVKAKKNPKEFIKKFKNME